MLDWLKNINKEYPEFYKNYLLKFESKPKRFVILSTESSGLNPSKDVIYSFGAIAVVDNNIIIGDNFEVVLLQYKFLHDNELSNEFLIESKLPKMSEPQAIEQLINFIGNAVLVGHRIHFDVEMINEALDKMHCGRLKNEALDIEIMHRKLHDITDKPFALDQLSKIYKLPASERTSSVDDAYNIALLFLKLKSKLQIH
ncbi:MAG TPA: 3'-5' exonuclease [Flavobacterium sp.]|jgi:DNA polymerase-3 subunit epsilon